MGAGRASGSTDDTAQHHLSYIGGVRPCCAWRLLFWMVVARQTIGQIVPPLADSRAACAPGGPPLCSRPVDQGA